jgi:hypothetical protein
MSFTMEAARVLVEAVNLTANDTMVSVGPRICREGGKGTFLPLFANEHTWPADLRGIL